MENTLRFYHTLIQLWIIYRLFLTWNSPIPTEALQMEIYGYNKW